MINRFVFPTSSRLAVVAAPSMALAPASKAHNSRSASDRCGQFQPMPIAIADFSGEGDIGQRVSGDHHQQTRQPFGPYAFAPVDTTRVALPGAPCAFDAAPRFDAWKAGGRAGAGHRAASRAIRRAAAKAEFRLWDVATGHQTNGQQYVTDPNNGAASATSSPMRSTPRSPASAAFFDTRVVFVDEPGPKEEPPQASRIMDQDGANVRYLTDGDVSVVTPRYSPVDAGRHLHVAAARASSRACRCSTSRPASARSSATSPT